MLSKAVKSHWRLAYRMFLKAIKVTFQDFNQNKKARAYINKIQPDLYAQRRMEKIHNEEQFRGQNE